MDRSWLDPDTRRMLETRPPLPDGVRDEPPFALVLLERGPDPARMRRAAGRISDDPEAQARMAGSRPLPLVCSTGLEPDAALAGHLELLTAGAISAYVPESLTRDADRAVREEAYTRLKDSDEFAPVAVEVRAAPDDDGARRFLERFTGDASPALPWRATVTSKLARLMDHWARRAGVDLVRGGGTPS